MTTRGIWFSDHDLSSAAPPSLIYPRVYCSGMLTHLHRLPNRMHSNPGPTPNTDVLSPLPNPSQYTRQRSTTPTPPCLLYERLLNTVNGYVQRQTIFLWIRLGGRTMRRAWPDESWNSGRLDSRLFTTTTRATDTGTSIPNRFRRENVSGKRVAEETWRRVFEVRARRLNSGVV